jgi:chromosome segregation ATPase
MARVPTVDEIYDTLTAMLTLAQTYVTAIKDREKLVAEREATIPRLQAEIQAKMDGHVKLDKDHRELQEKMVKMRSDFQREEKALRDITDAREEQESALTKIRQELSGVELLVASVRRK